MIHKKCNDQYKYGCKVEVDVETEEELKKFFYLKNTYTGPYFQNVCKECVKRHRRELYDSGEYNWRKKNDRNAIYSDKVYTFGVLGD